MNTTETKPTPKGAHTPGRSQAEQFSPVMGNDRNGHYDFVLPMAKNEDFQANCRLISAAPALLTALDALLNATDGLMDLYDDESRAETYADDLKATSAARDRARAAIAKAERGA